MNLFRRIVDRILTRTINFLIDVRDLVNDSPVVTFGYILERYCKAKVCPWCDGLGLLTKDGKSIQED